MKKLISAPLSLLLSPVMVFDLTVTIEMNYSQPPFSKVRPEITLLQSDDGNEMAFLTSN